ncbi:MAG: hypothetical protein MI807_15050 [Verrucomicrobiales bacterium]|nr:hypothetical protein [Verrucomicrobiales bacterium]
MTSQSHDDRPLQELRHDAVPGFLKAFTIAFLVMGIYLAIILISSPGSAKKKHYGHDDSSEHHATDAKH